MCEFCEEQKIIEFFDGKITWHIREKGKGYDTYYANSKTGELGIIDISYCPICGRKLTDGEEKHLHENEEKFTKCDKCEQLEECKENRKVLNINSGSMQGLKNVGTADYTRFAKGIEKIANLNSGQISKAASAIVGFGKGLQSLNSVNVSKTSEQVANLAKGISQLGYKSSTKAIENIPLLAKSMRQLMSELSKAPKVSQNLIDMTNALAKLARTGASSGRAANALSGSLNTYTKSTHKASKGIL